MSINKAQAKALADGFLGVIGSGKDGFIPSESLSEVFLLAGNFIQNAQGFLTKNNASGNLSQSLEIVNPSQNGCDVEMDFYGQFLNDGVRGVKSGSGKYAFKTLNPSPAMLKALKKSIGKAKRSTRNTNSQKTTSRNEKKNVATADAIAWGAAVNIKKKGIKAVHFLDKAERQLLDEMDDRLAKAFSIDVLNSLPPSL